MRKILVMCMLSLFMFNCANINRNKSSEVALKATPKTVEVILPFISIMFPGSTYAKVEDVIATKDGNFAVVSIGNFNDKNELRGMLYIMFLCEKINKKDTCKPVKFFHSYMADSPVPIN